MPDAAAGTWPIRKRHLTIPDSEAPTKYISASATPTLVSEHILKTIFRHNQLPPTLTQSHNASPVKVLRSLGAQPAHHSRSRGAYPDEAAANPSCDDLCRPSLGTPLGCPASCHRFPGPRPHGPDGEHRCVRFPTIRKKRNGVRIRKRKGGRTQVLPGERIIVLDRKTL